MRILSARITAVHRLRAYGEVEALVKLLVKRDADPRPYLAEVLASVPARAPGAAPLRDRLLASAKLSLAAGRATPLGARHAA